MREVDLRGRLARLDRLTSRPAGSSEEYPVGDRMTEGIPDLAAVELGLRECATAAGAAWVREWREPLPDVPETLPDLDGILSRRGDLCPVRDRVIFLDTETTGLAGGTGTLAFLIGVAWWEGAELVVRQLLLPGPGREGGMLAALAGWAAPFAVVVTFNGATFDLPLLRTRALMNRRSDPLAHLMSWDLLPACRRLWGRGLPDCRQQTVETAVCGLERGDGDIEGSRIPEVWRAWLAGGDTDDLQCVLRHNRRDLSGMAHILGRLCGEAAAVTGPAVAASADWRRAWALARVAERRHDVFTAADWVTAAIDVGALAMAAEQARAFRSDAVRILKRARRWAEVEALLGSILASGGDDWAHREAAMLYEHRLPRLADALRHARLCGEHERQERLLRKLARAGVVAAKEGK